MYQNLKTLVVSFLFAIPMGAASLTTNGGFESPSVGTAACFTFVNGSFPLCGAVPGWSGSFALDGDLTGGTVGGPPPNPNPEGSQWAMVFNSDSLTQSINLIQPGTYTLTWSDAGRGQNPFGNTGNQSYSVSFGGNIFGFFTTTTGSGWTSHSIAISSGVGTFNLVFGFSGTGGAAAYLDNVQFNLNEPAGAGAPEPATLGLMSAGLAALGWRFRRRNATSR